MATTPESLLREHSGLIDEARAEPRETGGVTTRLILHYVEREGGRPAGSRRAVVTSSKRALVT